MKGIMILYKAKKPGRKKKKKKRKYSKWIYAYLTKNANKKLFISILYGLIAFNIAHACVIYWRCY